MATVFLSHASLDDERAAQLEAWLRANGFDDLFVDHSAIRGGDKWADALRRAKASCRVVLCLVTPNWLNSDECFGEFTAAWYQGKRIVPLLAGAPADERQKKRLGRVLAEDQGFDLTPAFASGGFDLDSHPAIAEPFKAGLRAGGALMKVGLDPEAFEIDTARRPEPFPGLESFGDDDADAAIFYGRSPEIAELMETLRAMRATGELKPLVVLGASGSGKSSLMKAGLLPRLRRERAWLVLRSFRPGGDALLNFADAIARTAADLGASVAPGAVRDALLAARATGDLARVRATLDEIVKPLRERADRPDATVLIPLDQGEELSRAQGESADALGDVLRAALTGVAAMLDGEAPTAAYAVTVTVRTDTFAELQLSPRFADLDARCADIRPLPIYRFDNAVEGPAGRYGVEIDPGVVEALMEDAPGADALPLLAFAMQRLWRQYQAQRRIRFENYQSVGKLSGLLEDAAERALRGYAPSEDRPLEAKLPAERERLAQRTFVPALAQVSDQGAPIRRVADFGAFDDRERELIDQFDRWRLVVRRGNNEVEVAHEALFREWPRFRAWLDPEKARLDMLRSVEAAASAWNRHGRKDGYLDHRGTRLRDAKALLDVNDYASRIGAEQRDYLAAAGRAQLRRVGVMGGASLVALLGVLSAAAAYDRTISIGKFETHASILNGNRNEAGGARLAIAALGAESDLLKRAGGEREEDRLLAERALHESGHVLKRVADLGKTKQASLSDNAEYLSYKTENKKLVLASARDGRVIKQFDAGYSESGTRFISDSVGAFLIREDSEGYRLARLSDGAHVADLGGPYEFRYLRRSAYMITSKSRSDQSTELREVFTLRIASTGEVAGDLTDIANIQLSGARFDAPGGRVLIQRTDEAAVELLRGDTLQPIERFPGYLAEFCAETRFVCGSLRLPRLSGTSDTVDLRPRAPSIWDATTGRRIAIFPDAHGYRVNNSGTRAAVLQYASVEAARRSTRRVQLVELQTGALIADLGPSTGEWFNYDGSRLVLLTPPDKPKDSETASDLGFGFALFDAVTGRRIKTFGNRPGFKESVRFSQDGSRLVLTDIKNEGHLIDTTTGETIAPLGSVAEIMQRTRPREPISGDGANADYGEGLDRFFLRTEDSAVTMRRWSDGGVIRDLGRVGGSSSGVNYDATGKRFLVRDDLGVNTLRRFSDGSAIAIFGRSASNQSQDRAVITRDRVLRTLLEIDDVAGLRGTDLRSRVCNINRDWIGRFTEAERDPKKVSGAESQEIARRLRGRPWHVCDWRGLASFEGWGQMFRYWGVRLGLAKDWAPDERPGQPKPDKSTAAERKK